MSAKTSVVIGLIAARAGSKGIPKKNLLKLQGKELVRLAVEVGMEVKGIDKLICSSDSEEIAEVARRAGAEVPFIRPQELAKDDTPMLPVLEHAIEEIEKNQKLNVKCVVIIDPTAPLRTSEDLDNVIKCYNNNDVDLVISVHKGHHNPYFNMVEQVGDFFELSKGKKENIGSRQLAPKVYSVNTVGWVYSRRAVMEEKLRIPVKTLAYEFPESRSIDLDTPDDVRRLSYILESQ